VSNFALVHSADPTAARFLVDGRLSQWLTELLCDALALEYLGPAYVLAFAATVLSTSAGELPAKHPPGATRIRALLDRLKQTSWQGFIKDRSPVTNEWLEHVSATAPSAQFDYERFLVDSANDFGAGIANIAVQRLGSNVYDRPSYEMVAPQVEEFLRHRILPAQLRDGSPVPRRAILMAGWLHVLSNQTAEASEGDAPTSLATGLANDEFQMFLGKALEMSSVLQTWKSV